LEEQLGDVRKEFSDLKTYIESVETEIYETLGEQNAKLENGISQGPKAKKTVDNEEYTGFGVGDDYGEGKDLDFILGHFGKDVIGPSAGAPFLNTGEEDVEEADLQPLFHDVPKTPHSPSHMTRVPSSTSPQNLDEFFDENDIHISARPSLLKCCFNCGMEGHRLSDCPKPRKSSAAVSKVRFSSSLSDMVQYLQST